MLAASANGAAESFYAHKFSVYPLLENSDWSYCGLADSLLSFQF